MFTSVLVLLGMVQEAARADAGPPFLTNDPGTPGDGRWEINLGSMPYRTRYADTYEVPQIDLNFGLGDRIQLTYEIPYDIESGAHSGSGWSNAYPGIKWRFLDEGEQGWQMSVFPQLETAVSQSAARVGLGQPVTRLLLPVEVAHQWGPIATDLEAGYYTLRGPRERILGAVVGSVLNQRFELDMELYDDRVLPGADLTTLDVGGRYHVSPHLILLAMVGHSVHASGADSPESFGYVGVQILLSHAGSSVTREGARQQINPLDEGGSFSEWGRSFFDGHASR